MPTLPDLPQDRRPLPIGIFDSGIGGLTVAKALAKKLPNEHFIYFGDTAHLPYGEKSVAALQAYAVKITEMLLQQPVKAIVIACNTASAAAYELTKEYAGSRAQVLNVIDPTVAYLAQNYAHKRVGLIGTRQTVQSNAYLKRLQCTQADVELESLATPLLAPMIEEGFFNNTVSREAIHTYLSHPELADIEALVLACTHYPLIKNQIEAYYIQEKREVEVLDASELVADAVAKTLAEKELENQSNLPGTFRFFVSDYTRSFEASSQLFFGQEVKLQLYPLWS
jgi:glutamate racemase